VTGGSAYYGRRMGSRARLSRRGNPHSLAALLHLAPAWPPCLLTGRCSWRAGFASQTPTLKRPGCFTAGSAHPPGGSARRTPRRRFACYGRPQGVHADDPRRDGTAAWGTFQSGTASASYTVDGSAPAVAYQVVLTNSGSTTAEVTGFVVTFYDAAGNELGSDSEPDGDTFITSGQSLAWTEVSGNELAGYGVAVTNGSQDDSIPSDGSAASCQFIEWIT